VKIDHIAAIPITLEGVSFATSYGGFNQYPTVIIKLKDEEGVVGWGEASPGLPSEVGESQATISHAVAEHLAPALIGSDPVEIDRLHYRMDKALAGHVIAKAGIDLAVHDLLGKRFGVPTASMLGGMYRRTFRTSGAIGVKSADEMEADAKRSAAAGYLAMKVKLPSREVEDPATAGHEKIGRIREVMGPDVLLIVDVNQGWRTVAQAMRAIDALREFNVYIEQPIAAHDVVGMAFLTRHAGVPIIADEAVFTVEGALEVIRHNAAHIFNIKTTRGSGGLWKARRIIELAEAAGIFIQVDDAPETRVATTASAHLAATVRDDFYFIYSGGPACSFLEQDIVAEGGVEIAEDGTCTLPDGPGLGLDIDETLLEENRVELALL